MTAIVRHIRYVLESRAQMNGKRGKVGQEVVTFVLYRRTDRRVNSCLKAGAFQSWERLVII